MNLLQKHISGLRRVLDPATPARARSPLLAWTHVGYVLTIPAGHLDLDVYQREVNRARTAREAGDLPRAAEALHAALGLWRGPFCDGLASPSLDAERDRLAQARITTVEERIEVDLALGGHRDLIGELQDLVTGHPMRERLRGLLMLALYRSGRQAEALTVYRDTRRYLRDELGVDPDQQLQDLHQQILTADPALAAQAPTTAVPARTDIDARHRPVTPAAGMLAGGSPAAATRTLPRDIASFTGREPELAQLLSTGTGAAADIGVLNIHAIGGMAGIGKTTLAVHAAHRLAGDFPDCQIFLPLHAHTPGQRPVDPADALASLLLTTGLGAQQIPAGLKARAGRWRDYMVGKRILLPLDDAAGHEQIRPLLPATAGSLVLVTSRRRLTALEDAVVICLDTLPPRKAAALLARLAGRPELAVGTGPAGEITRLCGYLPLAIGMLARQLHHHPAWAPADLAADLTAARNRLELMHAENLSVAAAFDLSYHDLTGDQQRLFHRLGLHPGPDIDAYAAAVLDETSLKQARRHLDSLYDQHLITEPARGRYRLHDLVREHARALAAASDPADSDTAAGRLLDYYVHTALAASGQIATRTMAPGRPPPGKAPAWAPQLSAPGQAVAWLETERANLHAAAGYAAACARPGHAIAIPAAIGGFLVGRGHWDQAAALYQGGLTAARQAGDRAGQASALSQIGILQRMTGDYRAAATSHQHALALLRDLGDQAGQAWILDQLGMVQHLTGDCPAAAANHRQALALFRDFGQRDGEAWALNQMGTIQHQTGDYPAATASLTRALAMFRDIGDRHHQAEALNNLGELLSQSPPRHQARDHHTQALTIARNIGTPIEEARALEGIGQCHLHDGNPGEGTVHLQQALAIYHLIGTPDARRIQESLRRQRNRDSPALAFRRRYPSAWRSRRTMSKSAGPILGIRL